jgi:DNA-binding NtrC family response regulator
MRRAAVLADGKLIRAADLGLGQMGLGPRASGLGQSPDPLLGSKTEDRGPRTEEPLRALIDAAIAPSATIQPLATLRDEVVKLYVELAVARNGGDREAAAKALEIGVRSLYRYLA